MSLFLKANSLLISAPKSPVTLFTPDTAQAHYHPAVKIEGSRLPLERSPKLLGVYLDTFFSFNYQCGQVATRVKKKKQRPEGTGRHKLGATEKDTTDDIQGTREIYSQLCSTCLEHKCKHKQYWIDTESTE